MRNFHAGDKLLQIPKSTDINTFQIFHKDFE